VHDRQSAFTHRNTVAGVCQGLLTVAILLVPAACAPLAAPPTSLSTSHTPAAIESDFVEMPVPFNGDCTRLLDPVHVSDTARMSGGVSVAQGDPLFAVVGGMSCHYYTDEWDSINITFAPSAIVDANERAASLTSPNCGPSDDGGGTCSTTAAVAGWWYSVSESFMSGKGDKKQREGLVAIAADLEAVLATATAPDAAIAIDPFDCTKGNTTGLPVTISNLINSYAGAQDEISAAASLLAGPSICTFHATDGTYPELTVYPGGAAAFDQCARGSGGTPARISIPGVATAVGFIDSGTDVGDPTSVSICATDGKSIVTTQQYVTDSDAVVDPASFAELGTILVAIFDAAIPSAAPWSSSLAAPTKAEPVPPLADSKCTNLFDTTAVAAQLSASKPSYVAINDPLLGTVGGIACQFDFDSVDEGGTTYVHVIVAPKTIADPRAVLASLAPVACAEEPTSDEDSNCTATVTVDGWWYNLWVSGSNPPRDELLDFTTVDEALARSLHATSAPGGVPVQQPFDCTDIDVGGLAVIRSRVPLPQLVQLGTDAISTAAYLLAGPASCQIQLPNDIAPWSLTVYPGSIAAYDQCKATYHPSSSGTSMSVAGATKAFGFIGDNGTPQVCTTDGTSTIWATWLRPDSPKWTAKTLTKLGSLLVPTFAAIDAAK
jgi:hypothetical protein